MPERPRTDARPVHGLWDRAAISAELGLHPRTLNELMRMQRDGQAPAWLQPHEPVGRLSGWVWTDDQVDAMRAAREHQPDREPTSTSNVD